MINQQDKPSALGSGKKREITKYIYIYILKGENQQKQRKLKRMLEKYFFLFFANIFNLSTYILFSIALYMNMSLLHHNLYNKS